MLSYLLAKKVFFGVLPLALAYAKNSQKKMNMLPKSRASQSNLHFSFPVLQKKAIL